MCFDYCKSIQMGWAGSAELSFKQFEIDDSCLLRSVDSLDLVNPGLNAIKIRRLDLKIYALGGWDFRVRVYGVKKNRLLAVLDFHKGAINTIDFSLNNGMMAVGSNDNMISFWNLYSQNK